MSDATSTTASRIADEADDAPSAAAAARLLISARAEPPGVGEWIDRYQLVEEIGRSAHSVVYRARQHAPVARDVAIKVLSDTSGRGNVAARFFRERALLARVQHPGIASLLDCGETDASPEREALAWFAMPFVVGEAITHWCARHAASRATKLLLLERVADAVSAAHAAGVVHRDLKPSNILVTGSLDDPRVVVIDFGIAKLLDDDSSSGGARDALATKVGAVVGTPEYMSPEQADLDHALVTPTSDVYAIGLIACVLLAGSAPGLEGASSSSSESLGPRLRKASARVVPALSELAQDRSLRGEVEWIVAQATARDPSMRYPDARALADDLRRLREGQPIMAAPKDSGYPVRFVLRKHRTAITVGALALAAVIGAFAFVAMREKARADDEAQKRAQLEASFAKVRQTLIPITGKNRGDVVNNAEAVPMLEALHELNVVLLGKDAAETQQVTLNLARAYDRVDRWADAEVMYRDLLALAEANDERMGDRAFMRLMLGGNLRRQGASRANDARALLLEGIAYWDTLADPPMSRCNAMYELSMVAALEKDFEERTKWIDEGIACTEIENPEGHIRRREGYGFKADCLRDAVDFEQARAWYAKALDGLPAPSEIKDATMRVWTEAWLCELLWMRREEATRGDGAQLSAEDEAEFQRLVQITQTRDPANPRLQRWLAK